MPTYNIVPESFYLPTSRDTVFTSQRFNELFDLINAGDASFDVVPMLASEHEVIWYDSVSGTFAPTTIDLFNATLWDQSGISGAVTSWSTSGISGSLGGLATDEERTFTPSGTPTFPSSGIAYLTVTINLSWNDGAPQTGSVSKLIPVIDAQAFLDVVDAPVVRFWTPRDKISIQNIASPVAHTTFYDMSAYPADHPVSTWRWTIKNADTDTEIVPGALYSLVSGSYRGVPDEDIFVKDWVGADNSDIDYHWSGNIIEDPSGAVITAGGNANLYEKAATSVKVDVEALSSGPGEETTLKFWIKLDIGGAPDIDIEINGDDVVLSGGALSGSTWYSYEVDPTYWSAGFWVKIYNNDISGIVITDTKLEWEYEDATEKLELQFLQAGNYEIVQTATVPTWTPQTLTYSQYLQVDPAIEEVQLPGGGVVSTAKSIDMENGVELAANDDMPLPFNNGAAYVQVKWGIEDTDGSITKINKIDSPSDIGELGRRTDKERAIRPQRGFTFYTLESASITSNQTGNYVYFPNLETPCKIVGYSDSKNVVEVPTSYFGTSGSFPQTDVTFAISPAGERAIVNLWWTYQGNTYRRQQIVNRTRSAKASVYTRFFNIPPTATLYSSVTMATGIVYGAAKTSGAFTQSFSQPDAPSDIEAFGTTYGAVITFPKVSGAAGYLVRSYELWEASEYAEQVQFIEQPAGLRAYIPIMVHNGRPVDVYVYTVNQGNVLSEAAPKVSAVGGSLTIDDTGFTYHCGTFEINNAVLSSSYRSQSSGSNQWVKDACEVTYNVTVHNHDSNIHIKRIKCHVISVPTDAAATTSSGDVGASGIVNSTISPGSRIKIHSPSHGLSIGDTISLSGTLSYDGDYAVWVDGGETNYFEVAATYVSTEFTGSWVQAEVTKGYPLILSVDSLALSTYVWPEIYGVGYFSYPVDLYVPAGEDIKISLYKSDWYKYPTDNTLAENTSPQFKAVIMYDYDRNVDIEAQEEKSVFRVPIYQTTTLAPPAAPPS